MHTNFAILFLVFMQINARSILINKHHEQNQPGIFVNFSSFLHQQKQTYKQLLLQTINKTNKQQKPTRASRWMGFHGKKVLNDPVDVKKKFVPKKLLKKIVPKSKIVYYSPLL